MLFGSIDSWMIATMKNLIRSMKKKDLMEARVLIQSYLYRFH